MGRNKIVEDEDVLAAARDVFRREGHTASTREIARVAGISQAVLYQRFGSKEDLFFKAMTPELPDLGALLGPFPPKSAKADLVAIGERLLSYLRSFAPTLLHVLAAHGADVGRLREWHSQLPFFPLLDAVTTRFRKLASSKLISPGDARARAMAFISAIHSLALFELMTSHEERRERPYGVESVVAVFWQGLAPIKRPERA